MKYLLDNYAWIEAAIEKEKMRITKKNFGQVDALLIPIQKNTGATIVTGDLQFKELKKVILL